MSRVIRPLTAEDVDAVMALAEKISEAPQWKKHEYERCVDEAGLSAVRRVGFVAETYGSLVGFSVGKLVADICELESIVMAPKARGQGIGRTLIGAVEEWAQAHGANRIELEVRASNIRAIRFYEHGGMHREGLRPAYYQSPEEDAVLMGKSFEDGGKLP